MPKEPFLKEFKLRKISELCGSVSQGISSSHSDNSESDLNSKGSSSSGLSANHDTLIPTANIKSELADVPADPPVHQVPDFIFENTASVLSDPDYNCTDPEETYTKTNQDLGPETKAEESNGNQELSEEDKKTLYQCVKDRVNKFIWPNWLCVTDSYGIHILLLSRKLEKAVQRRLTFFADGTISLSVHCKPINQEQFLKKIPKPKPLAQTNIDYFVDRIFQAALEIRKLEICIGITDEQYKFVWKCFPQEEVDKNVFQETRYADTIRSKDCEMLVDGRKLRCYKCSVFVNRIRNKATAFGHVIVTPRGKISKYGRDH